MREKIEALQNELAGLREELKTWVKDKSISLDERWGTFINSGLGDHSRYIERFDCKIGEDYIDALENRYQTKTVEDVLKWAEEECEYSQEEIDEFRENVLKSFVRSFILDW